MHNLGISAHPARAVDLEGLPEQDFLSPAEAAVIAGWEHGETSAAKAAAIEAVANGPEWGVRLYTSEFEAISRDARAEIARMRSGIGE